MMKRTTKTMIGIAVVGAVLLAGTMVFAGKKRAPRASGPLKAADAASVASLRRDVAALCAIGERSTVIPENLTAAADLVEREFAAAGYKVERQTYDVVRDATRVDNVIVEVRGTTKPDEIVVIGAHYDCVTGTVGADDNASGVAALLALARQFVNVKPARTLRFVAFANEEPPHFQSQDMGSWQYAKRCRDRRENVVAMVSLETIGYYDDARGSQQYPAPLAALYPDTGNFIAFASNVGSRGLLSRCVKAFRAATNFPAESAAMPEAIPGIGWSDQWSFWQFGWNAIMVTDTAPFRNPHYHRSSDRPNTLDYERLAHVVEGLAGVVNELIR
ncbi:MAG TPA: M28 family peptidase [Thermoanaerobaculia bacterium]|jgi:Zn-dependent M28 family amino/carboxypeptidase